MEISWDAIRDTGRCNVNLEDRGCVNSLGRYKLKRHDVTPSLRAKSEAESGAKSAEDRTETYWNAGHVRGAALISRMTFRRLVYRNFPDGGEGGRREGEGGGGDCAEKLPEMEYRSGAPEHEEETRYSQGWTTRNDARNVIVGPSKYAHGDTDKDIFVAIPPRSFACLSPM